MAKKPTISGLEFEFNALEINQVDGSDVVQWDDLSGQSHHAIGAGDLGLPVYEETGFNNLAAVRLEGDNRYFEIWPSGAGNNPFIGTDLTYFAVIEATDISDGIGIIGSSASSTPPRVAEIFIESDGTIVAGFQWGPGSGGDVESSPGEISDGDQLIITFRHAGVSGGKLLRVNSVELDESLPSTSHLVTSTNDGTIGKVKSDNYPGVGTSYGRDRRFAWLSGYTSAATLEQILEMEAYLRELFFSTAWASCAPDPGTVWSSCN